MLVTMADSLNMNFQHPLLCMCTHGDYSNVSEGGGRREMPVGTRGGG